MRTPWIRLMLSLLGLLPLPALAGGEIQVPPFAAAPGTTRDLILVAGQSNAVGYDAYASDLPADPADRQVMFWWRVGDPPPDQHDVTSGYWAPLQAQPQGSPLLTKTPEERKAMPRQYGNFAKAEGGFGPEIGLARTLRAKEGKPLAIIKVAFSGTSVAQDWNPDDPGAAGSCYRALVETVKQPPPPRRPIMSTCAYGHWCGCRGKAMPIRPTRRFMRRTSRIYSRGFGKTCRHRN